MRARIIETRLVRIAPEHPDDSVMRSAGALVGAGGLVAFPTESFYGLGADALDPDVIGRVFEVKGRPEVEVENQGAEYGILKWKEGNGFRLGERVELVPSNLDMSTNVYDRYYVAKGERIVDVWPIMGREGAAQR